MKLKSIKLVGFKSFADNTVIPVRSHLTAIVGPNGCGKSNVVDAIRWVIGESSAKQLRGQSMSDVIFNGTTQRKPVGRAAVELIFDNTEGRIGGEYGAFNEISIKREVERDGQSSYSINGTGCRRRDILSVFLGTGLGSRSYAIIEQGMISRLVEAKPEEMRAHLEEVAGISKYKERRRETETRIRHTRENLERVNDIREELATQLRRLKRQANAAERYQVLKAEETEVQAQIKALQWQSLAAGVAAEQAKVNEQETLAEARLAEQRAIEAEIESLRDGQGDWRDKESEAQKVFYEHAAEIARIEQQIQHIESQSSTWQTELDEAIELHDDLTGSSAEQLMQIDEISRELEQLTPRTEEILAAVEQTQAALTEAEERMRCWQDEWDAFQSSVAEDSQAYEVSKTTLSHTTHQHARLSQRVTELALLRNPEQLQALAAEIDPLAIKVEESTSNLAEAQAKMDAVSQRIASERESNREKASAVKATQSTLTQSEAKLVSLQTLQQAALAGEASADWVAHHGLDSAPRLGQCVRPDSGWEKAVETVLGGYVQAVCVDAVADLAEALSCFNQGDLMLLDKQALTEAPMALSHPKLIDKVSADWPLTGMLGGVYTAASLSEAVAIQPQLAAHESVVTADGIWLGANWMRVSRAVDSQDSVLVREQMIADLQTEVALLQSTLASQEAALTLGQETLSSLEAERDDLHSHYQQVSVALTTHQTEHSAKQSQLAEQTQQQQRIGKEMDEANASMVTLAEEQAALEEKMQRLADVVANSESQRVALLSQRDQLRDTLAERRTTAQEAKQRADELGIRVSSNENQLNLLEQTVSRSNRQLQQLAERREVLTENLTESGLPLMEMKEALQKELERHIELEREFKTIQQASQSAASVFRGKEHERERLMKAVSTAKEGLQALQMKTQELTVRQVTIEEQLQATDCVLAEVIASLPEDASLTVWEERVDTLAKRIHRLGPINLGAIEEFDTLTERKTYLDTQYSDLEEALASLEVAIGKIDRETRTRFKETYEQVNAGFNELFPKIFGGGRATLEMEENDYLSAGVLIKAQPPGKRNASIHMLSGGEKALTAISLVFAMFRLNPAPFCVLDEVDAPLDDVNVGRFCNLVKEMATTTQFLVISHNKVSIAMADQLMGVTMHEAGVSRIVSVDVQEAIEMAEA